MEPARPVLDLGLHKKIRARLKPEEYAKGIAPQKIPRIVGRGAGWILPELAAKRTGDVIGRAQAKSAEEAFIAILRHVQLHGQWGQPIKESSVYSETDTEQRMGMCSHKAANAAAMLKAAGIPATMERKEAHPDLWVELPEERVKVDFNKLDYEAEHASIILIGERSGQWVLHPTETREYLPERPATALIKAIKNSRTPHFH